MSLGVYIIDDEQHAADRAKGFVLRTPGLIFLGTNTNATDSYNKIKNGEVVADIVILDIEMDDLPGDRMAVLIRPYTNIIFSTAHSGFAADAFTIDVIDFLVKPYDYERFLMAIKKAKEKLIMPKPLANEEASFFLIQVAGLKQYIQVNHDEIICVESARNYVKLHLEGRMIMSYITTKEMEEKFRGKNFLRIHKSYIINIGKIIDIQGNQVELKNGIKITVGRIYRDDFNERLKPIVVRTKRGDNRENPGETSL